MTEPLTDEELGQLRAFLEECDEHGVSACKVFASECRLLATIDALKAERDESAAEVQACFKWAGEANARIAALERVVDAARDLEECEAAYRITHDLCGDDHINTGRAWVRMRRAGDNARIALAALDATQEKGGDDGE